MRTIIFMISSDIKIRWFKAADCSRARYRCNPGARPEKWGAANLVNFHPKNASKVNLLINLFMNTVKHFVKISTQKLEIIQRKVAKRINCCLPAAILSSTLVPWGSMAPHLKSRFWLAEWTEPTWFIFGRLATHRAFFWYRMCGLYEWMRKFIHQDIVKSPKYGQQLYHVLFKLDCEKSVTESTQGKIYTI